MNNQRQEPNQEKGKQQSGAMGSKTMQDFKKSSPDQSQEKKPGMKDDSCGCDSPDMSRNKQKQ